MKILNTFLLSFTEAADATDTVKYIALGTIVLLIAVLLFLSGRKKEFDTRSIVYAAICISLSFALSFIKFPFFYGGSITLASFVPLLVYSYFFGFGKGLLTGIIYGLFQYVQEPFFLTPVQFLLDYILAFSSVSLAGLFKNRLKGKYAPVLTGVALVGVFRLAMHIFAGMIFFNAGWVLAELPQSSAFLYSTVYNMLYVVPDIVIAFVVIIFVIAGGYYVKIENNLNR